MSKRDWTPEPWQRHQGCLYGPDPSRPLLAQFHNSAKRGEPNVPLVGNAERALACVNALAGIEDPSVVREMKTALFKLANEVAGSLGLPEVREVIGNTNANCLHLRIDEARALLRRIDGETDEG